MSEFYENLLEIMRVSMERQNKLENFVKSEGTVKRINEENFMSNEQLTYRQCFF